MKNNNLKLSVNSSRKILQLIQKNSLISRADIAETLGITRAGVTAAVNIMMKEGIIEEAGEIPNSSSSVHKGRRKVLLRINENYKFVMGIIVEDCFVNIGMSNLRGDILARKKMNIGADTKYEDIMNFIGQSYLEILSENCIDEDMLLGIGFGITSSMKNIMNIEYSDCEPDFSKIRKFIAKYSSRPIVCGYSAPMTAAANMDFRSDIECRTGNEVFLYCGKSYSIAVICNNKLMEEFTPYSDIIERCIVNTSPIDSDGSVKDEITFEAVKNKIRKIYSKENTPFLYRITNGNENEINHNSILYSLKNNDEQVIKIYHNFLEMFSILINNLVCTNYAHRIVLHNTNIDKSNFEYLKKNIAVKYGKDIADKIALSGISADDSFLAGCSYAIRKLFYNI